MKINDLIKKLDGLSSNKERKEYLESIRKNPTVGRHSLERIACNVLIEENFIDKYYRTDFIDLIKIVASKTVSFFKRFVKKQLFFQ